MSGQNVWPHGKPEVGQKVYAKQAKFGGIMVQGGVTTAILTKRNVIVASALALAVATFFSPQEAWAADWSIKQDSAEERPWELGILIGVPFGDGGDFGVDPGLLLGIPVCDRGFVPINDSFYLEVGAFTNLRFFDSNRVGVTPFSGVRWNFHLMAIWDAYAALRLGLYIHEKLEFSFDGVVGSTWKFSKHVGLRGELGGGLGGGDARIGIDIDFE